MGVPTLTQLGDTYPTYQGAANLSWLGLEAFIASSSADYVDKAISWASRLDELNRYRQSMRSKFQHVEANGVTPATYIEETLRTVWRDYCDGKPNQSHSIGFNR